VRAGLAAELWLVDVCFDNRWFGESDARGRDRPTRARRPSAARGRLSASSSWSPRTIWSDAVQMECGRTLRVGLIGCGMQYQLARHTDADASHE
jgi:hypothetical protein